VRWIRVGYRGRCLLAGGWARLMQSIVGVFAVECGNHNWFCLHVWRRFNRLRICALTVRVVRI
jgi:hypothetical protein